MSEGGPSFFRKLRNLAAGALVAGTTGATIEANAHPVQNAIDRATSGVHETVGNIQEGKEALVNFYNEDPAIEKYNRDAEARLSGKSDLLPGEELIEKITIVPAGANYDELLAMKNSNEPVNVRAFPSTYTPTGNPTEILGTLPQGAEITHVLRVNATQPNSPENGPWYGMLYKLPESGVNRMGWIYNIYGQPEPADAAAGEIVSANNTP